MKKTYSIIFSLGLLLCLIHSTMAQNVNIPDANFKAYLVGNATINTNGDADIQVSEANAFSGEISVPGMNITDVTGIEAFTSITNLNCAFNQLSSLNVSANTALTYLYCDDNLLTSLDVSANTALTLLNCPTNSLSSLDVSANTALKYLKCYDNSITSLNLSSNTALESLWCYNNSISTLNVSANTSLNTLKCGFNSLTNLDVSANALLINLYCENNSLTSLDVRNGNNSSITNFDARNNAGLTCINVSDVAFATNNWASIDAGVTFNLDCSAAAPVVNIPDANFKAYLVGEAGINTNGDSEIQVSEALTIIFLDVTFKSISDLTGLEAFTSLTSFYCSSNQITSLDISANTALTTLQCTDNTISILDVSTNTALTSLLCNLNSISNLDLSANPSLTTLNFGYNSLVNVDVSANTALTYLNCEGNSLTNLNLSENTLLANLDCRDNSLTSLDISTNTALTKLDCSYNSLTNLDLSANILLTELICRNNSLVSLDVSTNTALNTLYCDDNLLTSLDIRNGNNSNITWFDAGNNAGLTCISVSDVAFATTNWTNIDAGVEFNLDCSASSIMANFSANATSGEAPVSVQFTDATTGTPNSWSWDFGDGSTSELQSPSHVYTTQGLYTVSLTVGDGTNTATETKVDYINITIGGDYIMTDGTITTDRGIFYDAGGANTGYSNDENFTMTFVPATSGNKLKFVFEVFDIEEEANCGYDLFIVYDSIIDHPDAVVGIYCNGTPLDQFEATNVDGAVTFVFISDASATYNGWKATISSVTSAAIIANFSADVYSGETPLTVQFTDESTGTPTSWFWDFGDGKSSTSQSPSHTYTDPGTYSVSLLVGDGIGTSTETKVDYVTVNGTKVIVLSGNMNIGNVDVEATATTTLNIANSGNEPLSITAIDLPAGFSADWTSGTIVASGSKNVIITFAPTEAKDYNGTITVNGDQTGGTNTITVSGTGIAQTITGIDDIEKVSLNCYPNPVVDILNITFDHTMESIIIVNMQGVTVFKKSRLEQLNGKLEIDVSGFKVGEHIIQLMKKEKKETLKVLIVK